MMKRILTTTMVAAMALAACGSDDNADDSTPATGSGCADITGNYDVKVTPLSGDCPPGDGKNVTVTITRSAGALSVAIPGIEGGCPAELNATSCKFTALCKVVLDGQQAALFNYDYTFTGTSFNGTIAGSLSPPVADPACQATARHQGKRI